MSRALLLRGLRVDAQSLERFVERRQRCAASGSPAPPDVRPAPRPRPSARPVAGASDRARYCRPAGARAPRPCAPVRATSCSRRAVNLLRSALPIAPPRSFPHAARSSRPASSARNARMLFADRVDVRLQSARTRRGRLPALFPDRSAPVPSLRPRRLILLALRAGPLVFAGRDAPVPAAPPKAATRRGRIPRPACAARDPAPARLFPASAAARARAPALRPDAPTPRSSSSSSAVSSSASRSRVSTCAVSSRKLALQRQRAAARSCGRR